MEIVLILSFLCIGAIYYAGEFKFDAKSESFGSFDNSGGGLSRLYKIKKEYSNSKSIKDRDVAKVKVINQFYVKAKKLWIYECKLVEIISKAKRLSDIPDIALTPSQQAIIEWAVNGKGNAVINAVAGSGKTTTLMQVIKHLPDDATVLYCAYNTAIKNEMQRKLPAKYQDRVSIQTLHGYGLKSLTRMGITHKNVDKKNRKYSELVKSLADSCGISPEITDNGKKKYPNYREYTRFVELVMVTLTDYNDSKALKALHEHYSIEIPFNASCVALIKTVIEAGVKDIKKISYSDMLYMPNKYSDFLNFKTYDFVLVDECQDLNMSRHYLVEQAMKGGRMIAVGDADQAIYGFTGADANSFGRLVDMPNTTKLPLNETFRCDKAIVAEAKIHRPDCPIVSWEGAGDGTVEHGKKLEDVAHGDMVLSRNNAPLVVALLRLIASKKKATIIGKDFSSYLIIDLQRTKEKSAKKALAKIMAEYDAMINDKERPQGFRDTIKDKKACLEIFAHGASTTDEIVSRISQCFVDAAIGDGITLATAHKSKGLEAERVFCIDMGLSMIAEAPLGKKRMDWEITQEANLRYVAATRAIHYLGYIPIDSVMPPKALL